MLRFGTAGGRRLASFTVVLALAAGAVSLLPLPVSAHGSVDQQIAPIPPATSTQCDAANFKGFVVAGPTVSLEQEFAPSVSGLTGADLCLEITTGATPVTTRIRSFGLGATNPGPVLRSTSKVVTGLGVQWVHFDFSNADFTNEVPTVAGTKYVLEVAATTTAFRWRTTCGTATDPANSTIPISPCSTTDPDRYPAGKSNYEKPDPTRIGDFGFRTLIGFPANLTGAVSSLGGTAVLCPGSVRTITATVSNGGANAAGPVKIGFYLSGDSVMTTADTLIGTQTLSTVAGGSSATVTLANATIPSFANGRGYLGVIVDSDNQIAESNENDNTGSAAISVFCGHAGFGTLSLTEDSTNVGPGAYRVPLASIPLEAIGFATTGTESAPTYGLALSGTSLSALPTYGLFAGAPQGPISQILLSEIPVAGGWHQYLIGTPYENVPEQKVTLAQALASHPALPLGDVDFAHSGLRNLTFGSIATAGASLTKIATVGPNNQPWCTFLGGQGYDCASYGIHPSTTSLLGLDLLGVRATIPWSSMALRSMDLTGTPLLGVKLSQFRIRQTPARLFAISAISNSSTFVSCSCQTLGDAEAAGAIKDGPTFGDLLSALVDRNGTLGTSTLGDFLMGALLDREDWPVGALALDQAPLYANSGQLVTGRVTVPSTGTAPLVDPKVSVVPPPGFLLKPGTSKITAGGTTRTIGEPSRTGSKLTWNLTGPDGVVVDPGTNLQLQYTLAPGVVLGYNGSTLSATADDQFGTVAATQVPNAVPVRVSDVEETAGNANDSADTAPIAQTGEKIVGHVDSSTDVDWYRVRVPAGSTCAVDGSAGAVQPGCRITVSISAPDDPQADFDLSLWSPPVSTAAQGSPTYGLPTYGLPTYGLSTEPGATQKASPETVQDFPTYGLPTYGLPTYGLPTYGLSATQGSSDERVGAVVAAGMSGYFSVEVWGRNGSTSDHPYVLSISVTPPPSLPSCTPRTFGFNGTPGTAPSIPSDFHTLILVNSKRMGDTYGATQTNTLISNLRTFAARPEVDGVVYPVDSDPTTTAKLAAWDGAPCDVAKANEAETAIASLVNSIGQGHPSFSSVVVVGSDEIFPMVRIPDEAPFDIEDAYAGQLVRSTGNTAVTSAAAQRFFLSDDGLSTDKPFAVGDHQLFVPNRAVGRLVETPAQIQYQLDQYVASGGLTDAPPNQTALVTGFDFVRDGADAMAAPLSSRLGASNVATLNCDTWTKQDVQGALLGPASSSSSSCLSPNPGPSPVADVIGLNGHADNFRLQPPGGAELLTTADIPSSFPAGRVVFSVGCHFGLNLPNTAGAASQVPAALTDWAETFGSHAAVVVGNTGYGYGDSTGVALSEKLLALFTQRLDGSRSVGDALRDAKREYYLSDFGAYDGFDEKAMQELVLYGFPSFRVAGSGTNTPPQPPVVSLQTDPITGLQSRPFDSGTISATKVDTGSGSYYTLNGQTLDVDRRPIVPQASFDVTNTDASKPGYRAAGLFLTGTTTTTTELDPVIARAEVDQTRSEPRSLGAFPVAPGAVTYLGSTSRLLVWPGKFVTTSTTGDTKGLFTLASRMTGTLYYSNVNAAAPRIVTVDAEQVDATHLRFEVLTDGGNNAVKRVGVMVGSSFADLQQASPSNTNLWIGVLTVPANVDLNLALVQAASAAGVGTWGNNGGPLTPTTIGQDDRLVITPSGTQTNGWFTGDASVSVTAPAGFATQYSLDGSAYQPYVAPVDVSGTAHHIFRARASNTATGELLSSTEQILIDVTAPTVTVTAPSGTYDLNSVVAPAYSCGDAGSGISTCTGPGSVDTSTPGPKTYTVTATDVAGNVTTVDASYTVRADTTAPTITITTPQDGKTYTQGSVVKASYSCVDSGGSGLASCTGTVANGANIDTSYGGAHTFTVSAIDYAGNPASLSVTYYVPANSFDGFYSPVSNPPVLNQQTAGNTEPFKFRVFAANGTEITSTSGFTFGWRTISCTSPFGEVTPDPYSQTATSNPSFRYDSNSHFFVFNAVTQKSWKSACRKFIVMLPDRTPRFAYMQLT